jgi:hypothetical protein
MAIGTVFTLFAVPAFYMLIATDHRAGKQAPTKPHTDIAQPQPVTVG